MLADRRRETSCYIFGDLGSARKPFKRPGGRAAIGTMPLRSVVQGTDDVERRLLSA
jgi:hypothetical protein